MRGKFWGRRFCWLMWLFDLFCWFWFGDIWTWICVDFFERERGIERGLGRDCADYMDFCLRNEIKTIL